ncbi:protein kinase [Hoyosella sp. YIM 151337]|uniref:serine/threonine-protein kinase n=1 Tax=Hoyosella sp. YIM 151337 TaxID=2992742 RepID=UPI0022368A35|nr:serine/threonine-protein kinase [Hoyosella sp. YIM 151337]MCW4354656.1 protein kinase [Hoyosella sp. YIM 151337]
MTRLEPDDTRSTGRVSSLEAELAAEGLERAEIIGRGGFGTVFRCFQSALGREVAVKVLSADVDPNNRARFVREQRAMAQLSGHPHVVEVLHADVTMSGRPYIVMPYHSRNSLGTYLTRHGPFAWPDAVSIMVKVAGALESGHRVGILHRDVKPANILITDYGEPQLSDFGIARVHGGFETTAGEILGSPAYTAPEIVAGEAPSVASDVYGLGATLFCLVTGHAAVARRTGEEVVAHFLRIASAPVPRLGQQFPRDLSDVIGHTMAISPSDRPASAAEFGERLRVIQRSHGQRIVDMAISPAVATQDTLRTGRPADTMRQSSANSRPPSAATKFRPPLAARTLVKRARLIDRITAAGRRQLVIIHAPAGFGKSTLAAQWREHLLSEGVSVAWLSIDPDDNNLTWFLEHLIQAIQHVRPELASELRQVLEQNGDEAERFVLTSLINEIHEAHERLVIVIDDWHRATNPATTGAIDFLLEKGCHHLQLVVTSRSRQGLPLSRMRVADELVEIDSADLRFDLDEARALLVELGQLPLEVQDVANLRETTDGWVAALQLASLSLRNHEDPGEFINHLSGRHRAIAEYLADNVLSTLDPSLLNFMLATSVSERTCAELATTLSGRKDAQDLLESIEHQDLFLRALDDDRQWFRYHHLFADFLRRRLDRDHPGRLISLHREASQWFASRGMVSDAVDHALAAGDSDRATDLVERDGMSLLENSQMSTLLGLISKLPPEQVADRPRLQIALGWAHVLLHHAPEPTQRQMERTKSMLSTLAESGVDVSDWALESSLVQSVGNLFADRIEGLFDAAEKCLVRAEALHPFVVSGAANVAAFDALHRFEFSDARRWIEWAYPYHQKTGGPFATLYGYLFAGMAAHEQLAIEAAEELVRRAQHLAIRSGGRRAYAARLAGAVLGELLYERSCTAEAEQLLDECHQLGAEGGVVDFMLITYGTGARIKAATGQREAALQRLDEGAQIAAQLKLPRLAARIDNERVRCALQPHCVVTTTDFAADSTTRVDGIAVATQELIEESRIRELLRGDAADIESACTMARNRRNRIGDDRPRARLQAAGLLAASLHAAGRDRAATEAAAPAIARCAELALPQFLLDSGPGMASLVRHILDAHTEFPQLSQHREFLAEVLGIV